MKWVKEKLWQWPDGFIWKITEKITLKLRKKVRFVYFFYETKTRRENS